MVTHYWLPHMGGVEVMAREQALALAARGWEITIFTSRLRGDSAEASDEGLRVRRFRCINSLESKLSVPVPLISPGMLGALVKSAPALDVIVAHGHVYVGSSYAALASRLTHVPFVVVQANPFVEYGPILNRIEDMTDRTIGRAVLEHAGKVVAISDFTKQFVESIAPRAEVTRVHPGTDLKRFFPSEEVQDNARPLFVTLRRLVPRSGIEVLVRAWVDGDLGKHADLAIGGDGPLKAALIDASRTDPSIRFLGRLSDNDLPKFYRSADVFVLPTVSGEGYGLALAEALASGLPAVVTDDGAPRELVVDHVNGFLVAARDAEGLASTLRMLASDLPLRRSLAQNVITRRYQLDRERSMQQLDTIFREIIGD